MQITWVKLLAFMTIVALAYTVTAANEHQNHIRFELAGMTDFHFTEKAYARADGQSYGGTVSGLEGDEGTITVRASHKGFVEIADWFNQQVDRGSATACGLARSIPEELHFAVRGSITIYQDDSVILCDNLVVAQGRFLTGNRWWIGGSDLRNEADFVSGAATQICKNQSGVATRVTFTPRTPCGSGFNVRTDG